MRGRYVLGCVFATLVFPCSCSNPDVKDVRDDFITPERAYEMGELSRLVYYINGTDNLNSIIPEEHYRTIGWIDNESTEVLVVVKKSTPPSGDTSDNEAFHVPPGEVIVAFRGSEETADWVVNVDQVQVPYGKPDYFAFDYPMYQPSTKGTDDIEEVPVNIHRGFSGVFKVYDGVVDLIKPFITENQTKLHVTGHSLGGANAQLFSSYYAFSNPLNQVYLTTFGAPRCGNRGFKLFTEQIRNLNMWRLVNKADVVPRIPYDEYTHAGHLLWNHEDGKVKAYYRQIGHNSQGYKGVNDFSIALMRVDTYEVLIQDHLMGNVLPWLEAAVQDPSSNFTDTFETIS